MRFLGLDVTPVYAGAGDMTSQQQDGQLDVIGFAAGLPIPAVQEVAALRDVNFLVLKASNVIRSSRNSRSSLLTQSKLVRMKTLTTMTSKQLPNSTSG